MTKRVDWTGTQITPLRATQPVIASHLAGHCELPGPSLRAQRSNLMAQEETDL